MLIEPMGHAGNVFGLVVIVFVLVVGPLALLWGADSRIDDAARRRRVGR